MRTDIDKNDLKKRLLLRINQKHISFDMTFVTAFILAGEQVVLKRTGNGAPSFSNSRTDRNNSESNRPDRFSFL